MRVILCFCVFCRLFIILISYCAIVIYLLLEFRIYILLIGFGVLIQCIKA